MASTRALTAIVSVLILAVLLQSLIRYDVLRLPPFLSFLSSSSSSAPSGGPHAVQSLQIAISSFAAYGATQGKILDGKRRSYAHIPARWAGYGRDLGYGDKLRRVREAGEVNARVCEEIRDVGEEVRRALEGAGKAKGEKEVKSGNQDGRVREALKHFVRDWSIEGARERDTLFPPVLRALERLFPDQAERKGVRVLAPGAGLARLPYEISELGFPVDANDYSYFMSLSTRLLFQRASIPHQWTIHPYIHSFSHHRSVDDMLRPVTFPDVLPRKTDLTLHEGDFLKLFREKGSHGVVVTLFFIDTAYNIVEYLNTIYNALQPGGVWINLGPLLWAGTPRMELTLEEVLDLARLIGFELEEHREIDTDYTGNTEGMFRYIYAAQFWIMRKPESA